MKPATKHAQRGGASLIVVMVMLFAMALVVAYANRSLLFEQRSSINQYHATQAFEAAEAGLEWAQARLNDPRHLDAQCAPAASGTSLRQRWLQFDGTLVRHVPITWSHGGVATAVHAACARTPGGWSCHCPSGGHPVLPAATAAAASVAFIVHAEAVDRAGIVRVLATGCTGVAGPCDPGGANAAEATMTVQALFGLMPGIVSLPTAPLSVHGDVDAGTAAIGWHNPHVAAGGVAVHAGGRVLASNARVTSAPGASHALAVVRQDTALAALDGDHLFASLFGLDKASWAAQPAVRRVVCGGDCGAALSAAIEDSAGPALLFVDEPLTLGGPLMLGTPERPVAIVASGAAGFSGTLELHGVLYAADIQWHGAAPGTALVRGALISEAGYSGDAAPDLFFDAPALRTLQRDSGSFVRLPGSWRDF